MPVSVAAQGSAYLLTHRSWMSRFVTCKAAAAAAVRVFRSSVWALNRLERRTQMQNTSPARLYALVFGVVLVVAGIIGFFYESEFTDDESVREALFGILDVNGWHNVVHIATGALGLLAFAAGAYAARAYALGLGVVYIAVAVWGFIVGDGDSILSIVPVNTEDNVLHLVIGLAGLGAAAASPTAETPRVQEPAT